MPTQSTTAPYDTSENCNPVARSKATELQSVQRHGKKVTKAKPTTLGKVLRRITQDEELKELTQAARIALADGDQEGYEAIKCEAPGVVPAGLFAGPSISDAGWRQASGLCVLDLDQMPARKVEHCRKRVRRIDACAVVAESLSRKLWALFWCPPRPSDVPPVEWHRACVRVAATLADEACGYEAADHTQRNPSRLRFLAHDPTAVLKCRAYLPADKVREAVGAKKDKGATKEPAISAPTLQEVESALKYVSPFRPGEEWRKILWGVRLSLGGADNTEARELCERWSSGELGNAEGGSWPEPLDDGWEFDAAEFERVWERGDRDNSLASVGTLFEMAKRLGWSRHAVSRTDFDDAVTGGINLEAEDEADTGTMSEAAKLQALREKILSTVALCPGKAPYVLRYQPGKDAAEPMGPASVNAALAPLEYQTAAADGSDKLQVIKAWDVIVSHAKTGRVPMVSGYGYHPRGDKVFTTPGGLPLLNTCKPWDNGKPQADWTIADDAAVSLWRSHLSWLFEPGHAKLVLQFLAHVVQRRGERVRWCPVLIGAEGCGKTLIVSALMRAALGANNVTQPDGRTVSKLGFNAWADGKALGCIEEIHVGDQREDSQAIVNALKTAITNDSVTVEKKGKDPVALENVTTWMATSNFAVPFHPGQDETRRWLFIRSRVVNGAKALRRELGGKKAANLYFARLVDAAEKHADALRGWLCSESLEGFDPQRVPYSLDMAALADTGASVAGIALRNLLEGETATEYANARVVSMKSLRGLLAEHWTGKPLTDRAAFAILQEMGYRVAIRDASPWRVYGNPDTARRSTWWVRGVEIGDNDAGKIVQRAIAEWRGES